MRGWTMGCWVGGAVVQRWSRRNVAGPALFLVREAVPAYAGPRDAPAPAGAPDPAGNPADPAGERADALLALGDRIADLARSIQVAEAEMMRLIVEFDRRRGWAEAGFGSCAEWLAWRIGVLPNAARERVRT
ncbi:MAG: hypothetical protein HKO98_17805, partial [Gemmatimonadetes bacterium]|nr:hypothetical protein [Gemmatimonadota bacterium]